MKTIVSVLLIAISLVACTNRTGRNDPADVSFSSSKPVDSMTGCLVESLTNGLDRGHHINTISPGKVFEVAPQQELMVGGEAYFVRVTATDTGSFVELKSVLGFKGETTPLVNACRS